MRKVKENERPTSERQKFSGRLQVRVVKAANLLAKKWNGFFSFSFSFGISIVFFSKQIIGLADSYCIIKVFFPFLLG